MRTCPEAPVDFVEEVGVHIGRHAVRCVRGRIDRDELAHAFFVLDHVRAHTLDRRDGGEWFPANHFGHGVTEKL